MVKFAISWFHPIAIIRWKTTTRAYKNYKSSSHVIERVKECGRHGMKAGDINKVLVKEPRSVEESNAT